MNAIGTATLSRHASRWIFRLSAFLLVAGVVAFLAVFFSTSGSKTPSTSSGPPQTVPKQKNVPLPKEAQAVAKKFILTAVQRTNLDEAWTISGPGIIQGMTRQQFLTGNIAVVPVFGKLAGVTYKIDYSHVKQAVLEVGLLVKGKNSKVTTKVFFLGLKRYGTGAATRWLVDSWVPWVPIPVPANPNA